MRRRVLVVEDNEDIRETLCELLQESGHDVRMAGDGPAGLRAALSLEWPPEVALVDIGLPGLDGYEVARQVRAAEKEAGRPPVYLVALTGYGQRDDQRRALAAGFSAHMVKPPDPERLLLLLERLGAPGS